MAYTPPGGGSISVELDIPAYTAPGGGAISVDLDTDEGPGGQSNLVAAAAMTITAYAPTFTALRATTIDAVGGLTVTAFAPARFVVGTTLELDVFGSLAIVANEPTYQATATVAVPASALTITGYAPSFEIGDTLDTFGAVTLTAHAGITQQYRIRRGVLSKYHYPSITLDVSGTLVVSASAGHAFSMRIRRGVESIYAIRLLVSSYVDSPYRFKISKAVSSLYNVSGPVARQVNCYYDSLLTDRVASYVVSPYGMPISVYHDSLYTIVSVSTVSRGISCVYTLPVAVPVRAYIAAAYGYQLLAQASIESPYNLTSPAVKGIECLYGIKLTDTIRKRVLSSYTSRDETAQIVTGRPYATVGGTVVQIEQAEVSIAEGEFMWKGTIHLTNIGDYAAFTRDTPFTITIGAEVFHFIMDTKELSRGGPANIAAVIYGVSPSAIYDEPRSAILNQSWDAPVLASVAAQAVIPGLSWNALDWTIPAYRLAASSVSPYALVSVIAQAIGATVETDLEGSVYVRSRFPTPVPQFDLVLPEHTLTDEADIFTASESYPSDRIYNRIIVSDIEDSINDSLEWIPAYDGALVGKVRAHLKPWRTGIWLEHTGRATTYINAPTLVLEEYTEVIEIFEGRGTTAKPVYSVTSVEYEANNVGALRIDIDSTDITVVAANPNTVIRLVYQSRSMDYPVGMVEGAPTQFLLYSPPL